MTPEELSIMSRIASVLERLEQRLNPDPGIGTIEDACNLLQISRSTLDRRRQEWREGLHWWREGGKLVFDLELLKDWQRNRNDPVAHQRAIEVRRKQLLSQKKKS